jgi:hypothetical protein
MRNSYLLYGSEERRKVEHTESMKNSLDEGHAGILFVYYFSSATLNDR